MLKSIPQSKLPSAAKAGEIFYTTDSRQVFFAIADGTLLNLGDLLSGAVPHVRVVGPQGERGQAGIDSHVPGPKGDRGDPGRDGQTGAQGLAGRDGVGRDGQTGKPGKPGKDGKDSVVPGPAGPRGERGEKGERGDVSIVGDAELAAAVEQLRAKRAAALALVSEKIAGMGNHGVYLVARKHLEEIQKELAK